MTNTPTTWPHRKGSIIPENAWNGGLPEFMAALEAAKGWHWWVCDNDLKYINVRIDTRNNGFLVFIKKDGCAAQKIDPQRVINAIAEFKCKYVKKEAE